MRKPALIAAALVLLVVCAGGGWYWWNVWRFLQATDDAYVQSDVTLISPKIEGYIKEVRARDNEPAAVGQVLFVIDDRDFAAKAAQAEAVLATQEATVATYGTRLKLQQTMIDQASANLRSAEADLDRAQRDYKRYTALATSDYASRQRYESAEADSRKAIAARLCDGEFQGDPADPHAAGPAGGDLGRRLPRPAPAWPGGKFRARQRRAVQPAAARQRHRKFHQGCAARAGAHRGSGRRAAAAAAASRLVGDGHRRYAPRRHGRGRRGDRRRGACRTGFARSAPGAMS